MNKLIRLLWVQMMIKECIQLIQQKYMDMKWDLVSEKEDVKCNNLKKQHKNDELRRCYKKSIHTEY